MAEDPRPEWLPRRKGDVWTKREGDATAVYDPASERLHILNATALAIWEACDGETTLEELAEAIAELAGLDPEVAEREVSHALTDLQAAGLIS